jgi:hypothetical protein
MGFQVRRRGILTHVVDGQPIGIEMVKATPNLTGKPEGNNSMAEQRANGISTYSHVDQLSVYG